MNIFCKVVNDKKDVVEDPIDSKPEQGISDRDLKRLYAIEFQSQSYASYYTTTMEKDKSILTLSVAGIGFLVTLLQLSKTLELYQITFFVTAALAFLVVIYCVITMFGKNADFIIDLTQDKDVTLKQHHLKVLDKVAIRSFYLAIIMSLALGISTSSSLIKKETQTMSDKNKPLDSSLQVGNESFEGAQVIKKSFTDASSLKPIVDTPVAQSNSNTSGAAAMKPDLSE